MAVAKVKNFVSFLFEQIFGIFYEYGFANRNVPLSRQVRPFVSWEWKAFSTKKTCFFWSHPLLLKTLNSSDLGVEAWWNTYQIAEHRKIVGNLYI